MTFREFGFDDRIVEAISYMGFEKATPIQEQAIPQILKGRDRQNRRIYAAVAAPADS